MALFAGAGGGILGGHLLGWKTVCAVEWEPYPACVLVARQNDKILPTFPIWDDVQTFDGKPWRGLVDVVSGGFPCQDISSAGRGAGIDGERSGMWREMARIIGEVRPRFAFVENSPMLVTRGLERVIADLTSMGYDSRWGVVSAADVGANHKRERIWIVAHSKHDRYPNSISGINEKKIGISQKDWQEWGWCGMPFGTSDMVTEWTTNRIHNERNISNASSKNVERQRSIAIGIESEFGNISDASWWQSEPNVGRVADGVAARVDRLKAIGNGQVPIVAATAFRILRGR
jgi:DNA (cytosine-5)-methyltransferase 1